VAPVFIPIALALATGAAGFAFGAVSLTAAIINVGFTALAAGYSYLTRPKSASTPTASAPANEQRNVPVSQATPSRTYAYGNVRTGGAIFFQDNNNPYLVAGSLLSDGAGSGIESVDAAFVGGTFIPVDGSGDAVAGNLFHNRFTLEWTQGLDSQTASAIILAQFPGQVDSTFRQQGVARAVVKLHWGADSTEHEALWGPGLNPSFQIRGLRVYDPRDLGQDFNDPTTYLYSDNPALCIAHALTKAWGVAIGYNDIDWPSVAEAANVCDVEIVYGGVPVKIFTLAGIFQSGVDVGSQLMDMLQSMRGRITYRNGKYSLLADAARDPLSVKVTDADVLELGEYSFGAETRARFNAISAKYFNAGDAGQPATTAPYVLSAAVATEGLRETSLNLSFTAQTHSAQIIAYRELIEGRDGRGVTVRLTDAWLYLSPGDVIEIDTKEVTFINGLYTVMQVDLEEVGASIVLKGYAPEVYADPSAYLV
jgi:hypothetical protein